MFSEMTHLSRETAHLHSTVSETAHLGSTVSGTAHLHSTVSETAHLGSTAREMARLHKMSSEMVHLHSDTAHLHRMTSDTAHLSTMTSDTAHLSTMTSDTAHLHRMTSDTAHLHSDMAHVIRITPTDPFQQLSTLSLSILPTNIQHRQGTQALLYPSQNAHTPSHANPIKSPQHMHSPAIEHQETNGTRFQQPRVHKPICP